MFNRSDPVKDSEAYAVWALRHRRCSACGIPHRVARGRIDRQLTTHHMAKCGRSDEPCNLLRLCWRCHEAAEGKDTSTHPHLSLANCLWLKLAEDASEFDADRFRQLLHRNPPDPEPPPAVYLEEFRQWTGQLRSVSMPTPSPSPGSGAG